MNVSRRGLLGIFAAGTSAAIIRTPRLLMPVKATPALTLTEWARRNPYESYVARVSELLRQSDDRLVDLPWIVAGPGDVHAVRTKLRYFPAPGIGNWADWSARQLRRA